MASVMMSAFAAVSVCAWAFSRDRIFALAAPGLFLAFEFAGHKYPLLFPAGQDDALWLAVAVCLDRIHHEEEDRHSSFPFS